MTDEPKTASTAAINVEELVNRYYQPLYQFAYSLTREQATACDLTQDTFQTWMQKGHQLRDAARVKTWLFTTLHRHFLKTCRHQTRFPHVALEDAGCELPSASPDPVNQLDGDTVLQRLNEIEELYRTPLALFYFEDLSYKEIGEILAVPIGTVQSRIARGKAQLQQQLCS